MMPRACRTTTTRRRPGKQTQKTPTSMQEIGVSRAVRAGARNERSALGVCRVGLILGDHPFPVTETGVAVGHRT